MRRSSTCLLAAAVVLAMGQAAFGQAEKEWDRLAMQVLSGEKLSDETIAACHKQFREYCDRLDEKNKTKGLYGYSEEDNAAHYVNAIKMSVINPAQHGGWPTRHPGRRRAYAALKQRLATDDAPAVMGAAVMSAIANSDAPFAIAVYKKLQARDSAWAKFVLDRAREDYLQPGASTTAAETFQDAFVPRAADQPQKSDGIGPAWNSTCNGQSYLAQMTAPALRASPDLDISKPDLPKPIADIDEIAFAKLEAVAGSRTGWTLVATRFCLPSWGCPDPALRKKWYYVVEFAGKMRVEGRPYPMDTSFHVPVTLDGRLGGIWNAGQAKVVVVHSR